MAVRSGNGIGHGRRKGGILTMNIKLTCAIAAILLSTAVSGLEIGLEGKISNIGFPWAQVDPTAVTITQFPVDQLFWGAKVFLSDTIAENLYIYANFDMDPVLRNSLSATIEYRMNFLRISAGPIFGLFNSPTTFLKSGLASRIELEWPGLGVFKAESNSSLGGGLQVAGDFLQESSDFMLGVYIGNTICSANVISKKFQYQVSPVTVTSDVLTEYSFKADIFKKNVPYNILMTIGYRSLTKSFVISDIQTNDTLGAAIIGAKVTVAPFKQLKLIADMEGAVYSLGLENLANRSPAMTSFIFKAGIGVSWSFDPPEENPVTEKTPETSQEVPEIETDAPIPSETPPETK